MRRSPELRPFRMQSPTGHGLKSGTSRNAGTRDPVLKDAASRKASSGGSTTIQKVSHFADHLSRANRFGCEMIQFSTCAPTGLFRLVL